MQCVSVPLPLYHFSPGGNRTMLAGSRSP